VPLLEVAVRRRLVGRVERGDEVVRAIRDAALRHRVAEGEVRGQGRLAWIDLAGAGPGVRERRDGPFEVVSLSGRVSVEGDEATVTMAVHALHVAPNLPAATGRLLAAGAIDLDLVVEPWDPLTSAARPVPAAESPKQAAWSKVVEASHKRPEREPPPPVELPKPPPRQGRALDLDAPFPEVGDDVLHPQFGRCRVVESADDKIAIRLASGRLIQLGTSVLAFGEPDEGDGRRVFPVEVRVRR
jgi:predicted DNA-binding protein with PD1-like motif